MVRERNFYREGDVTHYGQTGEGRGPHSDASGRSFKESSDFRGRGATSIDAFNAAHPHRKRGLAITPVKFGISFTATLIQSGAARWC